MSDRKRLEELRAKYGAKKEESPRERLERLRAKYKEPEKDESIKAGLMGVVQGATVGTSDEIWAGIQAGFKELHELVGGPKSDLVEAYSKAVKENRDEIKRLADKHPGAYIGGEIASLVIPGMGIAKLAKGTGKLAKFIKDASLTKKAMVGGAIQGATRGEGTEGKLKGAAVGAAVPALVKPAAKLAPAVVGGISGGIEGAIAGGAGSYILRKLGKHALKAGKKKLKDDKWQKLRPTLKEALRKEKVNEAKQKKAADELKYFREQEQRSRQKFERQADMEKLKPKAQAPKTKQAPEDTKEKIVPRVKIEPTSEQLKSKADWKELKKQAWSDARSLKDILNKGSK